MDKQNSFHARTVKRTVIFYSRWSAAWSAAIFVLLLRPTAGLGADVRFEVATPRTMSPAVSHRWLEVLKGVSPSGVRIYAGDGSEQPSVEKTAGGGFRVRGVITSRNQLKLPGGTFSLNDRGRLHAWVDRIDDQLPKPDTPPTVRLGLTAEQLSEVRQRLSAPVTASTADRQAVEVVTQIGRTIPGRIAITADARKALQQPWKTVEELQGVASGTALAAAVRPLGLVLSPQVAANGDVQLQLATSAESEAHWPVGWEHEGAPDKVIKKLLDRVEIDIEPMPIGEVVPAIAARLEVPVIWNHNDMARQRIDREHDEVEHPPATALYSQVLRRVLDKANLKYEVRLDEAGNAILWITPIRPR